MRKDKLSAYFIFISVLTVLTLFFAIAQKSYFSFKKPQSLVEKNELLKDFNPNIDLTIIKNIESRNENTDQAFDFSTITPEVASTDQPMSQTPVASPSSTPKISPTLEPSPTVSP